MVESIFRKWLLCLVFSFDLFILVWLSEILRNIVLAVSSGWSSGIFVLMAYSALIFFLFVLGIVPLVLLSIWFLNPLIIKKLFMTFGLTEKSIKKKKPKESQKSTELSEDKTENEILELVQFVDQKFKFTVSDFFLRGSNLFPSMAFIVFFAFIGVYLVFTRSLYEQIVVATSFSAFGVAFFSLLARFGEEHIVEVNFRRFGMGEEENRRPLLKALIKMKVKHQEFNLEQIYAMNKTIFTREKLLERLYE